MTLEHLNKLGAWTVIGYSLATLLAIRVGSGAVATAVRKVKES